MANSIIISPTGKTKFTFGQGPNKIVGRTLNYFGPVALFSTLTSSESSFTAGGAGVTLTFTAKDANDDPVEGYLPVPESGVV